MEVVRALAGGAATGVRLTVSSAHSQASHAERIEQTARIEAEYEAELRDVLEDGRIRVEVAEQTQADLIREVDGGAASAAASSGRSRKTTGVSATGSAGVDASASVGAGRDQRGDRGGTRNVVDASNIYVGNSMAIAGGMVSPLARAAAVAAAASTAGADAGAGAANVTKDDSYGPCSSCIQPLGSIGGVLVPRKGLGVTNPASKELHVRVCVDCAVHQLKGRIRLIGFYP